jgi:steroid delta-isomerase-like uncharacterized protein
LARTAAGTAAVGGALGLSLFKSGLAKEASSTGPAMADDKSRVNADPTQIAAAWISFWNSRDATRATTLFAHNVAFEDVTFGVVDNDIVQLETFAQSYFKGAPPDARFDLPASDLRGGHGTIEWLWTFTTTATFFGPTPGKKVAVRGASVIELDGTKIVRESDYWDQATVLRQIGQL